MTDAHKKTVQLTQTGLNELQAELRELLDVKLPAAVDRVARAREYGDLSENSEYHSARDDQSLLEARISEIENILKNAKVVKSTTSHSIIGIGTKVVLSIINKGKKIKKMTMQMVGEFEANPSEGKISSVSPIGKALLNKKPGEKVTVKAPAGEVEYQIEDIK